MRGRRAAAGRPRPGRTLGVIGETMGGLLAVALTLLADAGVSRANAGPLAQLAATVRKIASGDHARQVAVTGTGPVREIAQAINLLLASYERQHSEDLESRRLAAAAREAGIRIRAHLDLAEVLAETITAIERFVPGDAAYLHLLQDSRLGLPVGHEDDWIMPAEFAELPDALVPVLTQLLAQQSSQVLEDLNGLDAASVPPRHLAMLRAAGVVSMLVTPFGASQRFAGVIVALRRRSGHPWTPAEIDAFQQIAADIGRALEHARQFEAENRVVEELKALDRQKSTFIATVSHELRTPLTSIVGYIELLADAEAEPLTAKQEQMLTAIGRNAARLQSLIEDLLTMSKIESGAFRAPMRPVNLADVITPAVTAIAPTATAAEVSLTWAPPPRALVVNGDPGQLDQLLANLLSNAVKFTPKGGHVEVTAAATDGTVAIIVSDTGIGVPPSQQPLILTPFFRATNAVKKAIPGTGLGLTIAKTIVANHGGELAVDSHEGQGTTVTVRMPHLLAYRP